MIEAQQAVDAAIANLNRALIHCGPVKAPIARAAVRTALQAAWSAKRALATGEDPGPCPTADEIVIRAERMCFERMPDPGFTPTCEKEKGHEGRHRGGGLVTWGTWQGSDEADGGPPRGQNPMIDAMREMSDTDRAYYNELAKMPQVKRARIVVVESPYAAPTREGIERHVDYARACLRDCLIRGEAPYASHLLYTQPGVLCDEVPEERTLGMKAGFRFVAQAAASVVYTDLGTSKGMEAGIAQAKRWGVPVEYRSLRPGQPGGNP